MGIDVDAKALRALTAAATAERTTYIYNTTHANRDVERSVTVTWVGGDYLVDVRVLNLPGESAHSDRHIWIIDGKRYIDFADGRIAAPLWHMK